MSRYVKKRISNKYGVWKEFNNIEFNALEVINANCICCDESADGVASVYKYPISSGNITPNTIEYFCIDCANILLHIKKDHSSIRSAFWLSYFMTKDLVKPDEN